MSLVTKPLFSVQLAASRTFLYLHSGRLTRDKAQTIRDMVNLESHRHALREPYPGENRIDGGETLRVRLRVRDVDAARDAADMTAKDLVVAH